MCRAEQSVWYMCRDGSSEEDLDGCEDWYGEKGEEQSKENSLVLLVSI